MHIDIGISMSNYNFVETARFFRFDEIVWAVLVVLAWWLLKNEVYVL